MPILKKSIFVIPLVLMILLVGFDVYLFMNNQVKTRDQEQFQNSNHDLQAQLDETKMELSRLKEAGNTGIEERNKDLATISQIIRFTEDAKYVNEQGESLLQSISDHKDDGILNYYTTERRAEFVNIFLSYQKAYPKSKVEEMYKLLNLPAESAALHVAQAEHYLNVAEKLRDRTNGNEIFKYLNTFDYSKLRIIDNPIGNSVNKGMETSQKIADKERK